MWQALVSVLVLATGMIAFGWWTRPTDADELGSTTELVPVGTFGGPAFVASDSDSAGRVHIAFRTADGGARYVRRDADGVWTDPIELGGRGGLFVVADGDRVRVLVLAHGLLVHASDDGGTTWASPRPAVPDLIAWDGDVTSHIDGALVVFAAGWRSSISDSEQVGNGWAFPDIYPAGRRDGTGEGKPLDLWAFRSADGGATWTEPEPLGRIQTLVPTSAHPLLPYQDGIRLSAVPRTEGDADLYGTVYKMTDRGGGLRGGLHVTRSQDGGATWTALTSVDYQAPERRIDQQAAADVVPWRGRPLLVNSASEGVSIGEPDGRPPGSSPARWREVHLWPQGSGLNSGPGRAVSGPSGSAVTVWNDSRRARRTWYANTVWSILLGSSGWWDQSDLFVASLSPDGDPSGPVPMTPRGSLVLAAAKPFFLGGRVCAAWRGVLDAGRSSVGPGQLYLSCSPVPPPNPSASLPNPNPS